MLHSRGDQNVKRTVIFLLSARCVSDAFFIAEYFLALSIELQQPAAVITAASNIAPSSLGIP